MRDAYDDRFWADNHKVLSDALDRGFRRIGNLLRRMIGRIVPPDQSEAARKRTYCIG